VLGRFTSETAATIIAGGVNCWGVLLVRQQPPLLLEELMQGRLTAGRMKQLTSKNIAGRIKCWGVLLVGQQSPLLLEKSVSQPMQGGLLLLLEEGDNAGAAGVFYCWRSQVLGRFNIETAGAAIIAVGGITAQ